MLRSVMKIQTRSRFEICDLKKANNAIAWVMLHMARLKGITQFS